MARSAGYLAALLAGGVLGASSYAIASPAAPPDATHRHLQRDVAYLRLELRTVNYNVNLLHQKIGSPGLPTSSPLSVGGQLNRIRSELDAVYNGVCRSGSC
jgi:hypothetical protein